MTKTVGVAPDRLLGPVAVEAVCQCGRRITIRDDVTIACEDCGRRYLVLATIRGFNPLSPPCLPARGRTPSTDATVRQE